MLTARDIRQALVDLIKVKAQIPFDVHFNHINKSNKSYIWIEFRPQKKNIDSVYFQRILNVDIHVVLFPDSNAEVKHTDLLSISDEMDKVIMPCLQIKDRFITILNSNSYIFDDILHYEFSLDFTDCVEREPVDKFGNKFDIMQELSLKMETEE